MIEVWAVQLLHKPPSGVAATHVGWHQDEDYWSTWWDGEVFTCWLALSDVTESAGPVHFVPGSHEWGHLNEGNFFETDMDAIRGRMQVPDGAEWREEPAVLPAGGASFHHRRTIHGSSANTSSGPRCSYALHMRTEKSAQLDTAPEIWRDPAARFVVYGG